MNKELKVQASTKVRDLEKEAKKKQDLVENPDKIKPFVTTKKRRRAKKEEFYIDKNEMANAIKEYYETEDDNCKNYEKIGEYFIKIATGLASSASFCRYTYKDEMISDALIKMISALRDKKFSFEYGSSPFSYYTQIAYWSFCGRIKSEKKHNEVVKKYRESILDDILAETDGGKYVYIRPESNGEIFTMDE